MPFLSLQRVCSLGDHIGQQLHRLLISRTPLSALHSRRHYKKNAGDDITQADMASLESLQASSCRFLGLEKAGVRAPERWVCEPVYDTLASGIQDLTGLEFATNLMKLRLNRHRLSDLTPLKNLTKLTYLDLGANRRISDVTPLKDLTNLTHLYLRVNRLSDVEPLKNLTNLIELDINMNTNTRT